VILFIIMLSHSSGRGQLSHVEMSGEALLTTVSSKSVDLLLQLLQVNVHHVDLSSC
jgi:hypothetical protein